MGEDIAEHESINEMLTKFSRSCFDSPNSEMQKNSVLIKSEMQISYKFDIYNVHLAF